MALLLQDSCSQAPRVTLDCGWGGAVKLMHALEPETSLMVTNESDSHSFLFHHLKVNNAMFIWDLQNHFICASVYYASLTIPKIPKAWLCLTAIFKVNFLNENLSHNYEYAAIVRELVCVSHKIRKPGIIRLKVLHCGTFSATPWSSSAAE